MKRQMTKWIALFLAAIMSIGIFATTAFADEIWDFDDEEIGIIGTIDEGEYTLVEDGSETLIVDAPYEYEDTWQEDVFTDDAAGGYQEEVYDAAPEWIDDSYIIYEEEPVMQEPQVYEEEPVMEEEQPVMEEPVEPVAVEEEEIEGSGYVEFDGTEDELLQMYIDRQMNDDDIELYSAASLRSLDSFHSKIYNACKTRMSEVTAGKNNNASDIVITLTDAEIKKYSAELKNNTKLFELIQRCAGYCAIDYPYDSFWWNHMFSHKYNSSKKQITIHLYVSTQYGAGTKVSGKGYTQMNTKKISTINTSITNAKNIINKAKSKSDWDKLVYYRDQITNLNQYNNSFSLSDTTDNSALNFIYLFDGNPNTQVVCEGICKGFQYLCDNTKFSGKVICYCVLGRTTSSDIHHMWNIVSYHGSNYMCDLTNYAFGWNTFMIKPTNKVTKATVNAVFNFKVTSYTQEGYIYDADTIAVYKQDQLLFNGTSSATSSTQASASGKQTGLIYGSLNGKKCWHYVKNDKFTKVTGIVHKAEGADNKWYYVQDGIYKKATGIAQKADGSSSAWYYVRNGAHITNATGLAQKASGADKNIWYYVKNGVYDKSASTVAQKLDSTDKAFYVVSKGQYKK